MDTGAQGGTVDSSMAGRGDGDDGGNRGKGRCRWCGCTGRRWWVELLVSEVPEVSPWQAVEVWVVGCKWVFVDETG